MSTADNARIMEAVAAPAKANRSPETPAATSDAGIISDTVTSDATDEAPAFPGDVAEHVPVGTLIEYKRLDEYWDTENDEWVQKESAPPPTHRPQGDQYSEYCFTIVTRLHEQTGQPTETVIEIKSPWLKRTCRRVIGDINEVSWGSRIPRVDPFIFVRFYPLLEKHLASLKSSNGADEPSSDQLQLLLDLVRSENQATFEELEYCLSHSEITFDLLPCILLPDTILFTTCSYTGEPLALKLVSAQYAAANMMGPAKWNISAVYVEATGARGSDDKKFGYSNAEFSINDFKGSVKICSFHIYPIQWNPKEAEVRSRIVARGRQWEALDGIHHLRYDGVAYKGSKRVYVNSRVMVDRELYSNMCEREAPSVARPDPYANLYDSDDEGKATREIVVDPYPLFDHLEEEHFLLAPALLYGFSLGDKIWLEFNIQLLTAIKWNDEAFDRLVLPSEQKELIKGLVEAQSENRFEFDDYIEGKGRGLVINLFGPPGVGKTLSAEATSEHLKRPLYVAGAGDLGTVPSDLDLALTRIFKIGAAWGAVVLIDEADVFLEQRTLHDLQRNALVSVFLRQLEYFAGLLFITTNRVQSFDEAFQSRIHVSLRYRNLQADARRTVWRSFLEKIGVAPGALSLADEDELVRRPLNGRQIKNAVRTASALASSRKENVAFSHLKSVVDIMAQFDRDFQDLST